MKVLFLGDIVGRPGRKTVAHFLPGLLQKHQPDVVLANAENLSGGKGINRRTIDEMMNLGIHIFTGGNHSFANPQGLELFAEDRLPLLRPANFPSTTPGRFWRIFETSQKERLLVANLQGRIFMSQDLSSPFDALEEIVRLAEEQDVKSIFVDVHAEATSEKAALRWLVDGKVSALVGTHTHVQTADAEISARGTAFITDVGMCGSLDSCIGVKSDIIIAKLRSQLPTNHELMEEGRMLLCGVVVDIAPDGKARTITPVREILEAA